MSGCTTFTKELTTSAELLYRPGAAYDFGSAEIDTLKAVKVRSPSVDLKLAFLRAVRIERKSYLTSRSR